MPSALPDGGSDAFATPASVAPRVVAPAAAAPPPSVGLPGPGVPAPRRSPALPRLHAAVDDLLRARRRPRSQPAQHTASASGVLRYRGRPALERGMAVLVEGDASRDLGSRLSRLRVALERGQREAIDASLELWGGAGDSTTPRLRIRLRELLDGGGERSLELEVPHGARVWVHLVAPAGGWPAEAGSLVVDLESS